MEISKGIFKFLGIMIFVIIGPLVALSPLLFIPSVFATFSMSRPNPFAKPNEPKPDLSFNHTNPDKTPKPIKPKTEIGN